MATDDNPQGAASSDEEVVETIDATLKPGEQPIRLESPKREEYNPDKVRDLARANITYWLLTLLTVLIALAFIYLWYLKEPPTFEQLKTLVEILLGPVVALVSAATGFYFGAQSASKNKDA